MLWPLQGQGDDQILRAAGGDISAKEAMFSNFNLLKIALKASRGTRNPDAMS